MSNPFSLPIAVIVGPPGGWTVPAGRSCPMRWTVPLSDWRREPIPAASASDDLAGLPSCWAVN